MDLREKDTDISSIESIWEFQISDSSIVNPFDDCEEWGAHKVKKYSPLTYEIFRSLITCEKSCRLRGECKVR